MSRYWSEFSATLTWAMESQDQVEQELQQHQATMAFLRSQLLELLLKFQKVSDDGRHRRSTTTRGPFNRCGMLVWRV